MADPKASWALVVYIFKVSTFSLRATFNYFIFQLFLLTLQKKEEEYQLKKRDIAATKLQKVYRGFRYQIIIIIAICKSF